MQDSDAFAALYDREAHDVLVFIARRTMDAELALDLTAETFAQAWRGRRRFRGATVAEERAWLFTIAQRQISRYHRRGKVERRALAALGAEIPHADDDALREIDDAAELQTLRAAMGDELRLLSRDHREVLRLRVVEERPYPEIARALGITEQTARARVSRALRALARGLEPRLAQEDLS